MIPHSSGSCFTIYLSFFFFLFFLFLFHLSYPYFPFTLPYLTWLTNLAVTVQFFALVLTSPGLCCARSAQLSSTLLCTLGILLLGIVICKRLGHLVVYISYVLSMLSMFFFFSSFLVLSDILFPLCTYVIILVDNLNSFNHFNHFNTT